MFTAIIEEDLATKGKKATQMDSSPFALARIQLLSQTLAQSRKHEKSDAM